MRNLQNAAKDEKHWRASVWWLERRAPDRYARRAPDAISESQLQEFVEKLADVIVAEIASQDDRQRLLASLSRIAHEIQYDTSGEQGSDPRSTSDGPDGEFRNP